MSKHIDTWWPVYVAALAGFVAVAGAYFQVRDKISSDKKTEKAEIKADLNQQKADKYYKDWEKANADLTSKNEQINKLQEETIKQLSGFGYGKIEIHRVNNQLKPLIINTSNYPLRDVTIDLTIMNKIRECYPLGSKEKDIDSECYKKSTTLIFNNNSVYKKAVHEINFIIDYHAMPLYYTFRLKCYHSTFIQYSILKYNAEKNEFSHDYEIYENINNDDYIFIEKGKNKNSNQKEFEENFFYKYTTYFKK